MKNSDINISNKDKKCRGTWSFFHRHWRLVRLIAVIFLVGVVAALFLLPKTDKGVKPSRKYEVANKIAHKKVKGGLPKDWFTIAKMDAILPQKLVYVDLDTHAVMVADRIIYYETDKDNRNIIRAKDEKSIKELNKVIEKIFQLDTSIENISDIAVSIGALPEYIEPIATVKKLERNNCILSLIYNTVVGDSAGHVAVTIEKGKLSIVRAEELNLGTINVSQFYSVMQNIKEGKANTTGKNLLQILVQEDVLDTNVLLNVAYYDVRHDCIRGSCGIICKYLDDTARFQRIAKVLKSNPQGVYVHNEKGDTLIRLDDIYLCNDKIIYGNVDKDSLRSATLKELHPGTVNGLMLFIGLIIGLVSYPLLKRRAKQEKTIDKKNMEESMGSSSELITDTSVIDRYKRSEEFLKIKEKADKCDYYYDAATKLKDWITKNKIYVDNYLTLRNSKTEADLIELLDKYGMRKIHTFQQIKDKNYDLEGVVKMYDSQTKHNLVKELRNLIDKAKWYDDNMTVVVSSINSFRNAVAGGGTDRTFLFRSTMTELAIPILGGGYKDRIESAITEDEKIVRESRAYQTLMKTRDGFTPESMMSNLEHIVDSKDALWLVSMREAARRYKEIMDFSDTMWTRYVKDFIYNEPKLKDASSMTDKGWYFEMLMNITYHTADHIRCIKERGNAILCYNQKLMNSGFDFSVAEEFSAGNINKSTNHTNTIYQWATESGVKHLDILVDNYAILP